MKNKDTDQRINRVWGDPPASTQGAGKPSRGVASRSRRAAGVAVDVPTPPSVLRLNDELLAIEAAKNPVDTEAQSNPADLPVITSEKFVDLLLGRERKKGLLKKNFTIDDPNMWAQFEPYVEGCDWPELGPEQRNTAQTTEIIKYGISPLVKRGNAVVVMLDDQPIGRISFAQVSPKVLAAARLHEVTARKSTKITAEYYTAESNRRLYNNLFRLRASPFNRAFPTLEQLSSDMHGIFAYKQPAKYVLLGHILAEVSPYHEKATEELRPKIDFDELKGIVDGSVVKEGYSELFRQSSSMVICRKTPKKLIPVATLDILEIPPP